MRPSVAGRYTPTRAPPLPRSDDVRQKRAREPLDVGRPFREFPCYARKSPARVASVIPWVASRRIGMVDVGSRDDRPPACDNPQTDRRVLETKTGLRKNGTTNGTTAIQWEYVSG